MPRIPKRTKYASFGVAATIFEAADASKTYVRMPTSNATIEPRTTGTWYVGVCESSRHDWPNPAPDFVRVASMVLSPPWPFLERVGGYPYWDGRRTVIPP